VLYLEKPNSLSFEPPVSNTIDYERYISDPNKPVPYTAQFHSSRIFYNKEYMIEDQRFASTRPDVIAFSTENLNTDLTVAGPIRITLYVSSTGKDADFIVKIIDEFPETNSASEHRKTGITMAGYQSLVRAEIFRAKYRESYKNPQPLIPGKITKLQIDLPDIYHTFKTGHKIMLQVHSSWFPLYDRNPQKFMNIYEANEEDFKAEEMRVYYSSNRYPSSIRFKVVDKDLWEYETEKDF
jgi:putative CocE/NonD family hydrolase